MGVSSRPAHLNQNKRNTIQQHHDSLRHSGEEEHRGQIIRGEKFRQTELLGQVGEWMDVPQEMDVASLSNEFRDLDLFKEKDSEVIRVKDDDKKMEISLDTSQYRPDELNVSVANGAITVEGKHEEKAQDGHKMVSRQFIRKYSLPAGAKPEDVVSNLSSDGVLVVTANKSNPAIDVKINQK